MLPVSSPFPAAATTTLAWIYCGTGHTAKDSDGVQQLTVDEKEKSMSTPSTRAEDSTLAAATLPASASASEVVAFRRREGLLYAVASAVTGSITITLSKITMLLVRTTIELASEHEGRASTTGSNQLLAPSALCFIAGLACR